MDDITVFHVAGKQICIPTHQLKYTFSALRGALIAGDVEGFRRWIDAVNDKSSSLEVFDLVMSGILCGRLNAVQLVGKTTQQRKFESLTATGEDPANFDTVRLDFEVMVDGMDLAHSIYALAVRDMIRDETKAEFQNAIWSLQQILKPIGSSEVAEEILSDWVFLFRSSKARSASVVRMHDAAIRNALEQSEEFRDFIWNSLDRYKDQTHVEVINVKRSIEVWFAAREKRDKDRSRRGRGRYAGQLEDVSGLDGSQAVVKQSGLASMDCDTRSASETSSGRPTLEEPPTTTNIKQ